MERYEYELSSEGREPRIYEDARQAGAAFFAAKREETPIVIVNRITVSGPGAEPEKHSWMAASTARDHRDPSGYAHVLIDVPDQFLAGYEEARAQLPGKIVRVEDIQASLQDGPPSTTLSEGRAMSDEHEQQQAAPATQEAATTAPAEPAIEPIPTQELLHRQQGPAPVPSRADEDEAGQTQRLQLDGREVGKIFFEKQSTAAGVSADIVAYDIDGNTLTSLKGVPKDELTKVLGDVVGHEVAKYSGRQGILEGDQLNVPAVQPRVEAAKVRKARAAAPRKQAAAKAPQQQQPWPAQGTLDRATYSRTRDRDSGEYIYSAKTYDAHGTVLREVQGVKGHELASRFGQRVGFAIWGAKGRTGTLGRDDFNLTPERQLEIAKQHPLSDARELANALRATTSADNPVQSIRFARQAASPEAPIRISLSGYQGLIAAGVYSPEALKPVLGQELHAVLMDPRHIRLGYEGAIGPGVVEQTEATLDSMRRPEAQATPESITKTEDRLAVEARESAALERWAKQELGRSNVIENPNVPQEERAPLVIDKQPVDRLTYTRMPGMAAGERTYFVHAYDAEGRQLASMSQGSITELRQLVGGRNADLIQNAPDFRGSIEREQLTPKSGIELTAERVARDQQQAATAQAATAQAATAQAAQAVPQPAQATQAPAAPAQAPAAPAQAAPAVGPSTGSPPVDEQEALRRQIVAEMAQRFTVRRSLLGDQEYRPISDPERVVFVDRKSKVTTSLNTPDVAKNMVNLARVKGWETLHVKGSPEFKGHVWVEATLHDLRVTGYEPNEQDRERLAVRMQDLHRNVVAGQQPDGAGQAQAPAAQQPQLTPDTPVANEREAHMQQLMDVLKLALRDARVPQAKQKDVLVAARDRLETMPVLPEVRVFDAQVRTQQLQPRTQEPHQQRQQQTQHRAQ